MGVHHHIQNKGRDKAYKVKNTLSSFPLGDLKHFTKLFLKNNVFFFINYYVYNS